MARTTACLLGPLQLLSSTTHILIISTSQTIIDSNQAKTVELQVSLNFVLKGLVTLPEG